MSHKQPNPLPVGMKRPPPPPSPPPLREVNERWFLRATREPPPMPTVSPPKAETMTNETNPTAMLNLAVKILAAIEDTEASPTEKMAALRTAAFAVEQAMQAQNTATVIANIMAGVNKPKS